MRRAAALAALLLAAGAGTLAAPPPSPPPAPLLASRESCSLVKACGLPVPPPCSAADVLGVPGVDYDEERCREPRELWDSGFRHDSGGDLGFRVYRFLGRRYRVVYPMEGRVPISAERVAFLLEEMPFAARLLSRLQGTPYEAEWLSPDHRRFRAAKGESLRGDAQVIAGSPRERTVYWFGRGRSKLGPWTLSGIAMVRFDYAPAPGSPREILWRARVVSAPENAFYNVVMNLGIFRRHLRKHVREVVDDMTSAARKLDATPGPPPGAWTAEDQARIAALRALP